MKTLWRKPAHTLFFLLYSPHLQTAAHLSDAAHSFTCHCPLHVAHTSVVDQDVDVLVAFVDLYH